VRVNLRKISPTRDCRCHGLRKDRDPPAIHKLLHAILKSKYVGQWLDTLNNAFSGLKPLDLIERGEVDRLWRMIFEVESGALG
jgi:hypothetical protein